MPANLANTPIYNTFSNWPPAKPTHPLLGLSDLPAASERLYTAQTNLAVYVTEWSPVSIRGAMIVAYGF